MSDLPLVPTLGDYLLASSAETLDSVVPATSDLSIGEVLLTPPASPYLEVPSFGSVLAGVISEVPGESPVGGPVRLYTTRMCSPVLNATVDCGGAIRGGLKMCTSPKAEGVNHCRVKSHQTKSSLAGPGIHIVADPTGGLQRSVFLEPRASASGLDPEVQATLLGYEKPRPFLVSVLSSVGPDFSVSPLALAHFEEVATRPPDLGPTPSKRIQFNLDAKEEEYAKMSPPAVKGLPKDDQGVRVEGQAGKHVLRS